MKNIAFVFVYLSISIVIGQHLAYLPSSNGQVIKHQHYALSYMEEHEQAEWVAYYLAPHMLKDIYKRKNSFKEDPLVVTATASYDLDYKAAKEYDAGHLLPCRQMQFDCEAMSETFYMSNMSPQQWQFNQHKWSHLERLERNIAWRNKGVFVVTGPVLTDIETTIGVTTSISVPKYYYKVILSYHEGNKKALAFVLPNRKEDIPFKEYVVSIDSVEQLTGIDFFPQLADEEESDLEAYSDCTLWNFKNSYLSYDYTADPIKCGLLTANSSLSYAKRVPININTASQTVLESLPNIGQSKARAIIESRPFATKEELTRVSGIGDATFEKVKDLIMVSKVY